MKVIANNQERTIPIQLHMYQTFLKRFKGLMFRLKPLENEGIIINPCNSIHMFFMFLSIDVVFLDKANKIIYMKERVKPWTFILPIKDANMAIELPKGTLSLYEITIGDYIEV